MVLIKKKRNVWSSEEVIFFLRLVNEKHIVGLMDGKRLQVGDIFKTLVAPMEQAGFHRDVGQLTIKEEEFESGNGHAEYEFYETLDEIQGHRPTAQQEGFDSSQPEEVTLEELYTMEEDDARISQEMYDDDADIDGAIPGGSTTPGIQKQAAATPSESRSPASFTSSTTSSISRQSSLSKKSLKPIEVFAKMQNELRSFLETTRERELEADRVFLDTFLKRQEEIMKSCTSQIIKGLKDIFRSKSDDDED
ncbi:hypothetical protein FQA39_LY13365 [Lamprigera yunnana]|nr:hypothetical protein FQA39_LY13365 [Lamprigera yunnana]